MSLISSHIRNVTENRNNFCDLFEMRLKEIENKMINMNVSTQEQINECKNIVKNAVSKQEIDELTDDIKNCFSSVIDQTPRDMLNLNTKYQEMQQYLTEELKQIENRLSSLENASIQEPQATIRIPKLRIEKKKF